MNLPVHTTQSTAWSVLTAVIAAGFFGGSVVSNMFTQGSLRAELGVIDNRLGELERWRGEIAALAAHRDERLKALERRDASVQSDIAAIREMLVRIENTINRGSGNAR